MCSGGFLHWTLLGERAYASLARHSPTRSTWSTCSGRRRRRPASSPMRSRSAPRWCGCNSASATMRRPETAEAAGIEVIMNRCPKIEFGRLGGELSWSGVNSGIIRNRAPAPPLPRRVKQRPAPPLNLDYGFETRAIHAGAAPDPTTGARATPIYQTTAYVFDDVDHAASLFNLHNFGYIYSRLTNPTVAVLEERVASARGRSRRGRRRVGACGAIPDLLHPDGAGRRVRRLAQPLWRLAHPIRAVSFKKFGWTCHFVDPSEPENFRKALTPKCKAIFIENLANPGGVVVDIERVAAIATMRRAFRSSSTTRSLLPISAGRSSRAPTSSFIRRPSSCRGTATRSAASWSNSGKFDWSQGDRFPSLTAPEPAYHGLKFFENFGDFAFTMKARAVALRDFGPTLSPMNAFLTITGVETLHAAHGAARRERAQGRRIPRAGATTVAWVSYAGLKQSPYYELAQKYLPKGAGAVFTFGVKGGYEAGVRLVENVRPVLASRQYRRHPQPHPAPGLDHPSPAHRRAASRRRRRRRRHPPVDRA